MADIMGRAGLTHGGFYAHFSTKDELLAEALERASQQTCERLAAAFAALPAEQRLRAVIDRYLSPEHAAHPDRGCPVAALGAELARGDRKARRPLARSIRSRLDWLREVTRKGESRPVSEEEVVGALACMVGGLVLARGLGGSDGSALLKSCRAFLHRALGQDQPAADPARSEGS